MKLVYLFLSMFLSFSCLSQTIGRHLGLSLSERFTPFKEYGIVGCNSDLGISGEKMDSLKQEVKKLEERLATLPQKPVDLNSVSFILLYVTDYHVTIEASVEIIEEFCVSDVEAGKEFSLLDSGEAAFDQMQLIGDDYLVVTSYYHYLGNCEKFAAMKKYYVCKDCRK